MENTPQSPSPELFFQTVNSYQRTAALKAAITLDVFTGIAEGNQTAKTLASRCGAAERGMRILCDFLTIIGFLRKEENQYHLTLDSATFLDSRSPAYLGGAIEFLLSPRLLAGYDDLAGAVKKGGTTILEDGTMSPDNPIWVRFARGMMPLMVLPAQMMVKLIQPEPVDRKLKILDIAAGHGIFGITFAKHFPNAAVYAVDWSNVLEVAQENAQKHGVNERYHTIPGSAFDVEFGEGYDLVLLTNFLHHFDPPTNETLLKKVHAALADGGQAITLEFVPDDNRVTPPSQAAFSLIMLASTPSGDAYTFAELSQMLLNAGFSKNELHALPPTLEHAVVSYK